MRLTKLIAPLCLILSVASPANATVVSLFTLEPPAKYNKMQPELPVKVYALPFSDLQKACGNKYAPFALVYGCAKKLGNRCSIFVADKDLPNIAFPLPPIPVVTRDMIVNHEMAHCAGWPGNHPRH